MQVTVFQALYFGVHGLTFVAHVAIGVDIGFHQRLYIGKGREVVGGWCVRGRRERPIGEILEGGRRDSGLGLHEGKRFVAHHSHLHGLR